MPFEIEHSGHTWKSLGMAIVEGCRKVLGWSPAYGARPVYSDPMPRMVHVWPIEEYLVRTNHKPSVAERIARLNPDGKPEGEMPRGVHYTPTIRRSAYLDICDRVTFEKKWGKGSYRKLPKSAFVPMGGKRRAVSGEAYMEGPPCAA